MHSNYRYHHTLSGGVSMVEIKIPSHQEIIGVRIRAGKCAATRTIADAGLFREGNIHKMLHCKLNQRCSALYICIKGLVQFVIQCIIDFIDASLVTFKVNQGVNHIKFILICNVSCRIGSRKRLIIHTS